MRKKVYPFIICFITGLLWGVIIGAISISSLVSFRMDSFYERIAYLENTISLGKEVKRLDADILLQVIDKRIMKFNGAEYQLTVNKLVLSDILKLWVNVSLIEVES